MRPLRAQIRFVACVTLLALLLPAEGEVVLQYFNTSWREIARKLPELAEVGYGALWLPPPTKGSGGLSVGYDMWDPFDLGSKDQRGTVRTRYGTAEELRLLIETAHRFGLRVYFDNIMNHRAFDVPGFNEYVPIDLYPGLYPEDFHLRLTEEGFYRKWDNVANWGDTWQIQNRNFSDLIDIAQEPGGVNVNFGKNEGDPLRKLTVVRDPGITAYHFDLDLAVGTNFHGSPVYTFADKEPYRDIGYTNASGHFVADAAGNGRFDWQDLDEDGQHSAGERSEPFEDTGLDPLRPGWRDAAHGYGDGIYNMGNPVAENVNAYLNRAARWLVDDTAVDGLRLDAVKHVRSDFYGATYGADKDVSDYGYCGQAQRQFNIRRGFLDDNHRDTVFDTETSFGRNDLMMFGEHLGEPPSWGEYIDAGMRLVDSKLHGFLNGNLGQPWGYIGALEQAGGAGFAAGAAVMYVKSHDDDYATRPELQFATILTRLGLPNVYTDGNYQSETLGESGGAFPRHANINFLGQFGDNRVPNLVYVHNHFARGHQAARWSDADVAAYDRIDKRENGGMSDADGCVLSFMLNDNYAAGEYREIGTGFPEGAWLWQYSTGGGSFYTRVEDGKIKVIVPPGGYFAFSWRSPEESALWPGRPVTLYENGVPCGWVSYWREDGPDGDKNFNPYGVPEEDTDAFMYRWRVPRVTSASNVAFVARVDGSAANVLMKLDGGMQLNAVFHGSGDGRDHPPGNGGSTTVFEGYEQAAYVSRIGPEKFADVDTAHNRIGSLGAGSYAFTVGSSGAVWNAGDAVNDYDGSLTASYVHHDPAGLTDAGAHQLQPAPENAATQTLQFAVKAAVTTQYNRVYLYYTTDGATWPEGAAGQGQGATEVIDLAWDHADSGDGDAWWTGQIPGGFPAGTVVRYKIGAARLQDGSAHATWDVPFPNSDYDIGRKRQMLGTWQIAGFSPATASYFPHNDWAQERTGLEDGFHVVRARAFLDRTGRAAIYNTFVQPFYLDTHTPQGAIVYPGSDGDTLWDNEYGVVVRTDPTVTHVYFHIDDADPANDDAATKRALGNGLDTNGLPAWAAAAEVAPSIHIDSPYMLEWRFNYSNIPDGNSNATIRVKLGELSSATNPALGAVEGHFTELTRTVKANGPDYDLYVAWPQQDGDTVTPGYAMKAHFSWALWEGFDEATVRSRFLVTLDGKPQGRDAYVLTWGGAGSHHELSYKLPDLYDGAPEKLHAIVVTHTNAAGGGVTLEARRSVKAHPTEAGPYIDIVTPPEFDSDGKPYEIVLPDVANPMPEQRQYRIRVETDLDAKAVWLDFVYGPPAQWIADTQVLYALTGTVVVADGSNTVWGTDTRFLDELSVGTQLRIADRHMDVTGVASATNAGVQPAWEGADTNGVTAYRVEGNPELNGNRLGWHFLWTNMTAGTYRFYAYANTNDATTNTVSARALRNARVILREVVDPEPDDLDDDDDGLFDTGEDAAVDLPDRNAETWLNGEVHVWQIYGRTDPARPDTDGDGLPDGLESGWRVPLDTNHTDVTVDTDGDGFPNFRADLDPPFFNTVPDNGSLPDYIFYDARTKQIHGSMTDASNPDTDGDGLRDGTEDANRNGWADGDGLPLQPDTEDPSVDRPGASDWPDGEWGATWAAYPGRETDPNRPDTDDDGASDGYGEDTNFNGVVDGDLDSNRVWNAASERWIETDPLNPDTDGDGLPDGWERRYDFDPHEDGVIGHTNMRSGVVITNLEHGAGGNPDGDVLLVEGVTNEYTNIMELENGTNPRVPDTGEPPPDGTIVVGPGEELGTLGDRTFYQEFMDWGRDDLIALDEYEGAGFNNQQGDVYKGWDGYDESRDIVAFYAHDGGDTTEGGDGNVYFRVDFHDLKPYAEEGSLDLYVVIDTGNRDQGEMTLPDDVDTLTETRWEAVVAVYQSGSGRLYVDTDRANNTDDFGQDLAAHGVRVFDQASPDGFVDAYFNAELDAVEFGIRRSGLLLAGWGGIASNLNYNVFTTRDGTRNDPVGAGDIGGRSDIRDAVANDSIAEDYWQAQAGLESVLRGWIPGNRSAGRAKVASLVHGNQAMRPGSYVQDRVNTGQGAGYDRVLAPHTLFRTPLNLHVTPTLASAIEWAAVDPAAGQPWRDGPALNRSIAAMVATNRTFLLGSTFSDHVLPYFTAAFNRDNEQLARAYLQRIYATTVDVSRAIFWPPERVLDADAFGKIHDMGYTYTVVDQDSHLFNWFGREDSLVDGAYRINEIREGGQVLAQCFVINNLASSYRFENHDGGLGMALRALLNRKARSGTQDQVVTLVSNWDDFTANANADAYDLNVRWLANRPWTHLAALEQIARGDVDVSGDGVGDTWGTVPRSDDPDVAQKQAHNWLNHATQGRYDNWYLGQTGVEEGLLDKQFEVRPGTVLSNRYGMLYSDGIVRDAWDAVAALAHPDVSRLARAALHASVFQTAFHDEDNHDLRRYSTGEYVYPATSYQGLADFSAAAQSQTRMAAVYVAVDDWAAAAPAVTAPQATSRDIDLDGEPEYLLYNDRVLVVIEAIGGRMVGAWARDLLDDRVYQALGNPVGYPGGATEREGSWHVDLDGEVLAHRTSGLKDWWAAFAAGSGTPQYVNDLFSVAAATQGTGWRLTSSDTYVTKQVTLAAQCWEVEVAYALSGELANGVMYVRHGLSPDLDNLLTDGQATLAPPTAAAGVVRVANTNYNVTVVSSVGYGDAGHTAHYNAAATDEDTNVVDWATLPLRNQAQTQQIEVFGTGTFSFALGFRVMGSDWDADGMPNRYEDDHAFLDARDGTDGTNDYDHDGALNWEEYTANTDVDSDTDFLHMSAMEAATNGIVIRFPARTRREYRVWYQDESLATQTWANATPTPITVPSDQVVVWTDDGAGTEPPPSAVTSRFYNVRVKLPNNGARPI